MTGSACFMKETFLATLSPMLVMFLCILVGFVLRKSKVAPENTATVLSKLEINVLLPALNLKTFLTYCTVESIAARWQTVLYGAVAVTLSLAMAIPLAKLFTKDKNEVKIYRYSLLFANFGFLGNAIVPAIMGDAIMYDYMLFTIPMNIVLYAWAFNSLIPEGMGEKKSVWKSLLNPTSIAMTIGSA
jgi:predicted permease